MIKYSVVIPMYNSKKTIIEAIESIYSQTRFDLIDEIIVVDDGSKDDSYDFVKKYVDQKNDGILKLISKPNGGAASARNTGIRNSKNNYVALLDADDVWKENKIEIQNEVLVNNKNIRAIGSNVNVKTMKFGEAINDSIYKLSAVQYCLKNWPFPSSFIFDKTIFDSDFYFDEGQTHAEEAIFFLEIAHKAGLYYHVLPLLNMGGYNEDGTPEASHGGLSGNLVKMHKGVLRAMKKAKSNNYISSVEYAFLFAYEELKYFRRKVLTSLKK